MVLLKPLIFILTFYELIFNLDARRTCQKGYRVSHDGQSCDTCPDGFYQPEENDSQVCKPCTKCNEQTGSIVKDECTKERNTKCQCRGKFVPREKDSSTCKCDIGFGLKRGGTARASCSECEHGYFSTHINSPCQEWKKCKCGENITGTKTADVICNAELQRCSDASNIHVTAPPTSNTVVSLITRLTSHPTLRMHNTTTTTAAGHTVPVSKRHPFHPPDAGTPYIGTGMAIIFGIIGLLILTAVTYKLHVAPQPEMQNHKKNDSLCRRPIEESGD